MGGLNKLFLLINRTNQEVESGWCYFLLAGLVWTCITAISYATTGVGVLSLAHTCVSVAMFVKVLISSAEWREKFKKLNMEYKIELNNKKKQEEEARKLERKNKGLDFFNMKEKKND